MTGASVMGENVVDLGGKNVGRMALRKTMLGSVGGSVVGLVAVDSVRGAIASGKKARGASDDVRYRLGDLTAGSVRALKETAKSGGSLRRGENETYVVGDFSKGASVAICHYASENKERLGSTAGSSLGMAAGAMLLGGPIGLIAGGIMGARAGAKAFSSSENEPDAAQQVSAQVAANHQSLSTQPTREAGSPASDDPFPVFSVSENPSQPVQRTSTDAFHATWPQQTNSHPQIQQQHASKTIQPLEAEDPLSIFADQASHREYQPSPPANIHGSYSPHHQQNSQVPEAHYQQHQPAGTFPQRQQSGPQQPTQANYQQQSPRRTTPNVEQYSYQQHISQPLAQPHQERQAPQEAGHSYRFGDVTRSIVAKGKKSSGRREEDGYKFGDFTRGLFSKK